MSIAQKLEGALSASAVLSVSYPGRGSEKKIITVKWKTDFSTEKIERKSSLLQKNFVDGFGLILHVELFINMTDMLLNGVDCII